MYKDNLNKTLQFNEILNSNTIQDTDPILFIDHGFKLSDSSEIDNAFNPYFASVGKELSAAQNLEQHNVLNIDNKHYLKIS